MKQALSVLGQTIVMFLAAVGGFVAGMTVPAIRVTRVISQTSTNIRTYDYDWIFAVVLLYILFLLIGILRKRIRTSWITSTVALALTIAIVLAFTQLGIKDTPTTF
jgi:hypothetical protein